MQTGNVTFKGMKDALIIMLKEEPSFEEILVELEKKLESSVKFLKGVNYPIRVKGRKLSIEEFNVVSQKLKDIVGLDIAENVEDSKEIEHGEVRSTTVEVAKPTFDGIQEGITKFYRGTVRSGQLIKFDGNIVVIGDANPGSEIVAAGNIIVLGNLRGRVHAGETGNKDAIIIAFNLQPTQLRIADIITRPPEEMISKLSLPEIAFVKDRTVYIEYYLPNK